MNVCNECATGAGVTERQVLGWEEGMLRGQRFELWVEDGSVEWAEMAQAVAQNGVVRVATRDGEEVRYAGGTGPRL